MLRRWMPDQPLGGLGYKLINCNAYAAARGEGLVLVCGVRLSLLGKSSERSVGKFKYRVLREYIHVQQYFDGVALEWPDLPVRFFRMLHDALGTRLNIQPSELSVNPGAKLSEVNARYAIFGGQSAVTLFSDRLAFDFPAINS